MKCDQTLKRTNPKSPIGRLIRKSLVYVHLSLLEDVLRLKAKKKKKKMSYGLKFYVLTRTNSTTYRSGIILQRVHIIHTKFDRPR